MSFAAEVGHLAATAPPCECCLRRETLRTLKRALMRESLDGRRAALLSSAVMELESDDHIDPRAVLTLFRDSRAAA